MAAMGRTAVAVGTEVRRALEGRSRRRLGSVLVGWLVRLEALVGRGSAISVCCFLPPLPILVRFADRQMRWFFVLLEISGLRGLFCDMADRQLTFESVNNGTLLCWLLGVTSKFGAVTFNIPCSNSHPSDRVYVDRSHCTISSPRRQQIQGHLKAQEASEL
jgi:hypothetical protein